MNRTEKIKQLLTEAFNPTVLELEDHSEEHAGHEGALMSGGGHYYLKIRAAAFEGKKTLERHRMVYDALGDMMQNEIHALSIDAAA